MEGNVYPLIDYFNSRGHELDSSNTEALNHVWEGSIEVFKSGPMFHPKKCLSLDALLLGDPDSQEVFLPSAREEVAGIASQLLGYRESSISVGPLDLMLHAHTKPIRAGIRIDSADNNIIIISRINSNSSSYRFSVGVKHQIKRAYRNGRFSMTQKLRCNACHFLTCRR